MERTLFLGIDPGKNGGIAFVETDLKSAVAFKMPETERDVSDIFEEYGSRVKMAVLEKVGAMPKQGVKSMFTFGQGYGFLRGMLIAHKIPFDDCPPQRWQKELQCMTKGDKNITKAKAQQVFPDVKNITHATADALLIAEFCRREFELKISKQQGKRGK